MFEALGTIDEVSSFVGLAITKVDATQPNLATLQSNLYEVQCMLQDVNAHVATPVTSASQAHMGLFMFKCQALGIE